MKTKLRGIEHRAVSGVWLLGEDLEEVLISEETYSWLWRNIYTICDNPRLVKMFWANSNQYFNYKLQGVHPEYVYKKDNIVVANEAQVAKRKEERRRFLEFHYALGGLLLYRKQYKTLNYLFEYSQSQPPKYVLLPETMTEIFYWFEYFRNEFNHNTPIDILYYFPELDNLGNRRQVNFWICSYIVTLFLRQYTLQRQYTYQNFTGLPNLPDDVLELSSWLDSVSYFEICLNNLLANEGLIVGLEFKEMVEEKKESFYEFINDLKEAIKNKIGDQKLDAELSDDKIQKFYEQSNKIISEAFESYKLIFTKKSNAYSKSELKLLVNGGRILMSKSAFTNNDVTNLNYDTVFASSIATNKIKYLLPNAFFVARTKRYLFNKDNILAALSKIIGSNTDIIIIGIKIDYQLRAIIDQSAMASYIQYIPSTEYELGGTLFVLQKDDLPAIEFKELEEEEKIRLHLKSINEKFNLYASVIDINKDENIAIKDEWGLEAEPENQDFKVQLTISFQAIIYWKDKREIIQVNLTSEYREQGIQNELNDIDQLSNRNDK